MAARVVDSIAALQALAGSEIALTDWLTITQERIGQFAEATEDRQWIHIDGERAQRESPYGTTIAHGFLTLSLLSWFLKQAIEVRGVRMGVNYGLNRVRFPAPVPAGSRIRARVELKSAENIPRGCEAVFLFKVEREGSSKPCCAAEWVVRFYAE
jgi:acyl dehydratase